MESHTDSVLDAHQKLADQKIHTFQAENKVCSYPASLQIPPCISSVCNLYCCFLMPSSRSWRIVWMNWWQKFQIYSSSFSQAADSWRMPGEPAQTRIRPALYCQNMSNHSQPKPIQVNEDQELGPIHAHWYSNQRNSLLRAVLFFYFQRKPMMGMTQRTITTVCPAARKSGENYLRLRMRMLQKKQDVI